MNSPRPKNIPASVHQRLVNMARSRRNDVNLLLTRFTLERFLYRLSRSPYAESFIVLGRKHTLAARPAVAPYHFMHNLRG